MKEVVFLYCIFVIEFYFYMFAHERHMHGESLQEIVFRSGAFALPDCYIYQTGTNPPGSVKFDLTNYSGHVEVVVHVGSTYDSGYAGVSTEKIVYSNDR